MVTVAGGVVHLHPDAEDSYIGRCHGGRTPLRGFGGSVLAHALAAAYETVADERLVHSLHGYFLRAVEADAPVRFTVDRVRDGGSYSVRTVGGEQAGDEVFTVMASFKRPDPASETRQPATPAGVPLPEEAPDGFTDRPAAAPIRRHVEYREARSIRRTTASRNLSVSGWIRLREPLAADPVAHSIGLAYLSDATLASTALLRFPDGRPAFVSSASLDHSLWFHGPARADEWLLFRKTAVVEGDGRALVRGDLWTQSGVLAATVVQEVSLRFGHRREARRT
jgi:acyl-CoA thioesterase-2